MRLGDLGCVGQSLVPLAGVSVESWVADAARVPLLSFGGLTGCSIRIKLPARKFQSHPGVPLIDPAARLGAPPRVKCNVANCAWGIMPKRFQANEGLLLIFFMRVSPFVLLEENDELWESSNR